MLVNHGRLGRSPSRLTDENRAGQRRGLNSRRRVDEVSRDHALTFGAESDRGLACQHASPRPQGRRPDLLAERLHRCDELEGRPHCTLRVIFGRDWSAPDGHHCIADELLDRAAIKLDDPAARLEVARQKLAHLLRVLRLRERGETDQIGEQNRDQAALCQRSHSRRCRNSRLRNPLGEPGSALDAEEIIGAIGAATGWAGERQC